MRSQGGPLDRDLPDRACCPTSGLKAARPGRFQLPTGHCPHTFFQKIRKSAAAVRHFTPKYRIEFRLKRIAIPLITWNAPCSAFSTTSAAATPRSALPNLQSAICNLQSEI